MICGSCRRRCDPTRSFCTNCGSAVFIDARDEKSFFATHAVTASSPSSTPGPSPGELLRSIQRNAQSVQPATIARKMQARAQARARAAMPAFTLGPLIRFGIFVLVLWYAGSWLLRIPEVLLLKDRAQSGHFSDEDLQAAKNAVVERLQTFLRNAQDPNPPRAVESAEKGTAEPARPAEKPADAPVPAAQRPGAVDTPADTDSLPPGVSLPGDGVSMPRVLNKVNPEYTPEALRAKLEGTVLLQAVVRTHGIASDISVLRSLDRRFGLDQQAVAALKQWRFAPGQREGRPVPVLVQVEMNFALK